ncbi:Oidioi.mRNA.OKI2018_I69.PAR.g12389.t1.cds [Oikopleura dioica]|uniref:Oidioi.mRNA.OKI2018_I69.PAR.g12389.t1.cds n=1 Tax=Oikopleura dioica TaxID=34765 RepID=A0ABN7S090_OIKDI|nr:Oidioi.mRNA.OKI2018_I69.PAR.g12389.t1.cds [Oikopleura dioica]
MENADYCLIDIKDEANNKMPHKMKFICAGFPKTASKSASAAFEKLGFRVADYIETCEFLTEEWLEYMEGRGSIKKVLDAYERNNFDTNQDFPGNIYWEELWRANGEGKVVLTVRDNEHVWYESWINFFEQNFKGIAVNVATHLAWHGFFGKEIYEMVRIGIHSVRIMFGVDCCFEQKALSNRFLANKRIMKQRYLSHIIYVKSVVPDDKLLIWNIKDGWEPLCKFLQVPIPNEPIPRKNTRGELFEEYSKTEFTQKIKRQTLRNLLKLLFAIVAIVILIQVYRITA